MCPEGLGSASEEVFLSVLLKNEEVYHHGGKFESTLGGRTGMSNGRIC